MRISITIIALLLIFNHGFSQELKVKFGKLSEEEINLKIYEKDSSASAVILFDIGDTDFKYVQGEGFHMIFNRHLRVKILTKEGYGNADFSIHLHKSGGNKETIQKLKAYTYNVVNGKIEKTKLEKKDIYTEEENTTSTNINFSMPVVKEYSIIEVKYSIKSDFFYNLQEWRFQNYIPTIWSEYKVAIPEYYKYNRISKGYLPFVLNESEIIHKNIKLKSSVTTGGVSGNRTLQNKVSYNNISFSKQVFLFAVKDAPAMKRESYMLASNNYLSNIEFELAYTRFPNEPNKQYSKSWESINNKLIDHSSFGKQLKNNGYFKSDLEKITNKSNKPVEQIKLIYNFIQKNFKWNNINSKYTSNNLRKIYSKKSGNSADINLLLVAMLRDAGFNADPVILSTRNHGLTNTVHPSSSQMNYVIVSVKYNDKNILLDATDPYCLLGMLPPRCINDRGRIVNKTNTGWIDINPNYKFSKTIFADIKIGNEDVSGNIVIKKEGYAARKLRHSINNYNNTDDYIANLESNNPGIKISEYTIENIDSIHKPIQENLTQVTIESYENLGDAIFFSPILIDKTEENPFKMLERNYPIDYNYLRNERYIYSYTIPEGYIVDEMPKNIQLTLPNNSGLYKYQIIKNGNKLTVSIVFNINKRQFLPDEYQELKSFYSQIISKEGEQIVLKK